MSCIAIKPDAMLSPFVDCLWYFKGDCTVAEVKIPSGTAALTIGLDDHGFTIATEVTDPIGRHFKSMAICGPYQRYYLKAPRYRAETFGIQFTQLGASRILGLPMSELSDRHVALDDIWGRQATSIRQRLMETKGSAARFALLHQMLIDKLQQSTAPHPVVNYAIGRLTHQPTVTGIGRVVKDSGYSSKRFGQLFQQWVGFAPKRFCRIIRLNNLMQQWPHRGPVDWSMLALDFGYYDQSHLIREFRTMTGLTPTQYQPVYRGSPYHALLPERFRGSALKCIPTK